MELFLVFLLVAIFVLLNWCIWRRESYIPGPWGIPFIGCLLFLDPAVPQRSLHDLARKYGPIYSMRLGSVETVVLSDAALIRETLRRDQFTGRAPLFVTHGIMGGHGIICAEGHLWRDQRRQTIDWLKRMGMAKFGNERGILEKRITAGVDEFLRRIMIDSANQAPLDPMHNLHHCLGNILNDLVFGITYDQHDVTWKYLQNLQEEGVKHIGVSGIVNFLPLLRFLPAHRKTIRFLLEGKHRTHAIYDKIIAERLKIISSQGEDFSPRCILDYFLIEKERRAANNDPSVKMYAQEQLRHLLADMFGAGVDTTLTTLRWFLLYMAKNHTYQTLLRSKLSVYPAGELHLADLERLDFLRACIAETQRIRSVVPLGIPHGTIEDTTLAGYRIRKGTMVIPLQWAVHMDESVWPNPDQFDPFRFLSADCRFIVPQEFIPFQTGKRMCLGDDIAKMLLHLFCGLIVHNFEITLPQFESPDMSGDCGITLTPPRYSLIFKNVRNFDDVVF